MALINVKSDVYEFWTELCNNFLPMNYMSFKRKITLSIDGVDTDFVINATFWCLVLFGLGYSLFYTFFQKIIHLRYYRRKQLIRAVWNLAFSLACLTFLTLYHKYMISPHLIDNKGKLFPQYENTIFHKSQPCERFHMYMIIMLAFFMHSTILDILETDYSEAATKVLYSLSFVALIWHSYENYFLVLNISIATLNVFIECLTLIAVQVSREQMFVFRILLSLRIFSWLYVFVNTLPFKYLIPTLFAKDFKLFLNIFLWLWYSMCIWNSPVLQYFYHTIYHNAAVDCIGQGSAAICIMLKDSMEQKHFKNLKKAYLEIKLAHERTYSTKVETADNVSAQAFQTIKCVMALKRKLKRIRGRESSTEDSGSRPTVQLQDN